MYDFRLQRTDGSPADPPSYRSTVLVWRQNDQIPLNADRTLRVLGLRDDALTSRPPHWSSRTCGHQRRRRVAS